MNVLGVIPARGGSKAVAKKNIKFIDGKPLIAWTIEASKSSKIRDSFIVSSDDPEIMEVAKRHGAQVPFCRPAELATDSAGSLGVMQHAILWYEENNGCKIDVAIMLQPTTPFRTAGDIDEAIRLMENEDVESVISVVDVGGHHPARMKYLIDGFLEDPTFCEAIENQPRQELKPMFLRNGAIYATRRDTIFSGSFKGKACKALVMDAERSVNIDTIDDFEFAQWIASRRAKS